MTVKDKGLIFSALINALGYPVAKEAPDFVQEEGQEEKIRNLVEKTKPLKEGSIELSPEESLIAKSAIGYCIKYVSDNDFYAVTSYTKEDFKQALQEWGE